MSRNKTLRLHEVIGVLNSLYPSALAEDWDNVGLQVGDSDTLIDKILVCLDAEETALADSARRYRTAETRIVDSRQEGLADDRSGARLALVTCYPFDAVRPGGPLRFLVLADAIDAR